MGFGFSRMLPTIIVQKAPKAGGHSQETQIWGVPKIGGPNIVP